MKYKFGQFFLIIGLILLILFFTNTSETPPAAFFFMGLVGTIGGIYMMWRGRKPPEPSGRFRSLRKMIDKKK
jgi:hypothetical protein